jgi:predicted MFS family arabinose efflux permease
MTEELMLTFSATSTMLGVLVSFYYYSYTVLQLPCGIVVDKIGPRNLLGGSTLLCVLGALMFAMAETTDVARLGRFLIGAGSACAFISCLQIAASLFSEKYFAILTGITNMMGTFGGLLGGYPVAKFVNAIGWQDTTKVLAAVGAVIATVIFIVIPKKLKKRQQTELTGHTSIVTTLGKLLSNRQIIIPSIVSGLMYLTISVFAELWIVPFFMVKYGITNETASIVAAVDFVGVAIGSILMAAFARKLKSYVKTIRLSAGALAGLFVILIYVPAPFPAAAALVFAIGCLTGAQAINFTCVKNNASFEVSGTALAVSNCIVMLLGSIFQPIFGALLDKFWDGGIGTHGVRIYSEACYNKAMMLLPIGLAIACVLSSYIHETIHKEKQ